MKDLDDRELDDAMKQVRGTWRPWLLLVVTLGIAAWGGWQLMNRTRVAEKAVSEIDARIAENAAQIAALEQNKAELEKRIAGVDRENQSLNALRLRDEAEKKKRARDAVRLANLGKKLAEKKELTGAVKDDALVIAVPDKALFDGADPAVSKKGQELLLHVGTVLTSTKGIELSIESHTDAVPTAWETTAARGAAVARSLDKVTRTQVIAYGASRPIASNKTAAGRTSNRRIELRVTVVTSAAIGP